MWIIGGQGAQSGYDVWYSSDGTSWTRTFRSRRPVDREMHSSVVYGGKMWIIGGYDGLLLNDVWYSTNGTTWTCATTHAAWAPRRSHSSVVYSGKMWVIGGTDGHNALNDVWYSTNGSSWTLATARGPWSSGVLNHACVVFDEKMWVIAGIPYYNAAYSTNGTSWTVATIGWAPWLGRMQGMGAVACDRKLWVMGGRQLPPAWDSFANDVWHTTDGATWKQATPYAPWWPREDFALLVFDRKMWILGGATSSYTFLNDVWYSVLPAEATPAWKLYP